MHQKLARAAVRLSGCVASIDDTHAAWAAHVAAGRIGGNPPPPPGILAQRLATQAQFDAYRAEARIAGAA